MKPFIVIVFVVQTHAVIEWPFTLTKERDVILEVSAGSPSQPIPISVEFGLKGTQSTLDKNYPGLYLLESNEVNEGKSSTFKKIKSKHYNNVYNTLNGVFGTENFVIKSSNAKNVTLKQLPVDVIVDNYGTQSFLSLTRSRDRNTFLDRILTKEKEQVVVLVFDNVLNGKQSTGLLVLGGRPKNCKNWKYVPEFKSKDNNDQWNFVVDSVKVGDYTFKRPTNASIRFKSAYFEMSEDLYEKAAKELGVNIQGIINCDQKKKIVLTIGGNKLELGPRDYIDQYYSVDPNTNKLRGGQCPFNGIPAGFNNENSFVLPLTFLRNKCFLLDFNRKRVGFADKVKSN